MEPRARRIFSDAFKAETVELVRSSGKSIGQICHDLDLTDSAVRRWVDQAGIDTGERAGDDLVRARRANAPASGSAGAAGGTEDPKKAAAFFAREATQ